MAELNESAPGSPGVEPRWSPGPKTGVGTALSDRSNVWFTLGHGILNEVYYPRVDTPSIRDMGLLITEGTDYFSEEKRDTKSEVEWAAEGVPAFTLVNTSTDGRYKVEKQIIADPSRSCVLQHIRFTAMQPGKYHLYVLLAPHLGNLGIGNDGWIDDVSGRPVLLAQRDGCALALACSNAFIGASAGYVGSSDGWQDISVHKQMTWHYSEAKNGNVALTAEIDISEKESYFTLALGFGADTVAASKCALDSLKDGFDRAKNVFVAQWQDWHRGHGTLSGNLAAKSLAVLRTHQSKSLPGGIIAGLASPWGYARNDKDPIGYHIVWTRDMVESAGGLLAGGALEGVMGMLKYLESTQRPDGHWPQNMWLDGTPFWNGVQMDETALPIILASLARREGAISDEDVTKLWPMLRRAASYLVKNGPVTQQDRWEEDPGYTPFTIGAEIAALLAAADFAELCNEPSVAKYLRETADNWHDSIDRWMYVRGTDWSKDYGIDGYYERIAPVQTDAVERFQNTVNVKNVPPEDANLKATHLISPDALALVRFGLRAADDPRIVNTVKIIDALLKIDTPSGTTWHRYNDDGYGEHTDGSAFDGTGVGRGWPLLTGERAHYELLLGRTQEAQKLSSDMEHFANQAGLFPEQVWDSDDIPAHELVLGKPSGSAMPLAWAHAEYLKLCRSLKIGKVFDMPPQTVQRYLVDGVVSPRRSWRFNHKIHTTNAGKDLRIETLAPARVRWSSNNWESVTDSETSDTGLGVYEVDLPVANLPAGGSIVFTFYWLNAGRWEGTDFVVTIGPESDS